MASDVYKEKVEEIINKAKDKGLVKTYTEFCETEDAEIFSVKEEDAVYYTSLNKEHFKKFKIGDIVFVSHYIYKSGKNGQKHIFVIIDDGQAVDITYFGFLLSSQLYKSNYKYNQPLNKDDLNKLHKDSIVKCDDLISISETDILFKIGEVNETDLERFVDTYKKYLDENFK